MSQLSLEDAISKALAEEGQEGAATKAYFTFLRSALLLPIEKGSGEEPRVLFLEEDEYIFLPVFSQKELLIVWAAESLAQIDMYELSGIELLSGLGDNVTIALNPGSSTYKEFNPEEVLKLKTMVTKIRGILDAK
jgi:SseB protein N-terminal domain